MTRSLHVEVADMQDADLFLELAGIAGVFIGFGALIAVRSGGASGPLEVAPMRTVVSLGALTIVAALTPVTLSRYAVTDHQLWALSGIVVLVGWLLGFLAMSQTPEYRRAWATELAGRRGRWLTMLYWAAYVLYMLAALLAPVVIVLGLAPENEAALYFTVVVLILLGATMTLLRLVFAQRGTATS